MKFISTLFSTCLLAVLSFQVTAEPVELDRVRVIVNDGVILQSDIDSATKTLTANARKNNQELPSDDILLEQILDKLILEKLQLQEADRIGVRIDDNRLSQSLSDIAANNEQTLDQLRQTVAAEGCLGKRSVNRFVTKLPQAKRAMPW